MRITMLTDAGRDAFDHRYVDRAIDIIGDDQVLPWHYTDAFERIHLAVVAAHISRIIHHSGMLPVEWFQISVSECEIRRIAEAVDVHDLLIPEGDAAA